MYKNKCVICGKEFETSYRNKMMCNDKHIMHCVVCGKEIEIKNYNMRNVKTCCSHCKAIYVAQRCKELGKTEEANKKREETMQEKYGVKHALQSKQFLDKSQWTAEEHFGKNPYSAEEIVNKRKGTCLENYGVDNPAKTNEVKEKIKQKFKKNYGVDNPMQVEEIKEKQQNSVYNNYGVYSPLQNKEIQEKVKRTCISKYGKDNPLKVPECREKGKTTLQEKYGVKYVSQAVEIRKKISEARGKVYTETGIPVDSSYEKIIYDFCIRNNIEVEYQQKSIEYEYEGKRHTTIIDFCIDGILIECKGEQLLENCFKEIVVPIEKKLEVYEENDVVVVTGERCRELFTGSNGLRYKGKEGSKGGVIGVDIELFTEEPEFPYRSDRPKCYYEVKVNGEKSSHEAFYDERLRWEMIKNRIEYKGGYIDNRQILTALNVTRKCKQPSWFSKNFAKRIIEKYATGEVIVDTFAGWGTRCEASKELGKGYIGCDLNKEVVEWHHENDRKEIQYGDAKEFKYDKECTVFICPPYKDKEVYFEGQDCELTQCEWLKICMKNIPAAREYIMVCKVVDEGWEKYIVETKENKSHFGVNKEYVLCVKNNMEIKEKQV